MGKELLSIERDEDHKIFRMLAIYEKLSRGGVIQKKHEAELAQVTPKTVQRDIEDLRQYLKSSRSQQDGQSTIVYDRKKDSYVLDRWTKVWLTHQEVLALVKILLESRAFSKAEIDRLLVKIIALSVPEERKHINEVILNERHHYIAPKHNEPLLTKLWDLSKAIRQERLVEIEYQQVTEAIPSRRIIIPRGLMFSEYYFYLIAYREDYGLEFPIIYRLDRIGNYNVKNERFHLPDSKRFQEGEFRKRIQFMTNGPLMTIQFRFWGRSLEAVLDRLPTAKVVRWEENKAVIEAEVYGLGIKMWLLSQAEFLEVLKPENLRNEMRGTMIRMLENYGDVK